MKSSCSFRQTRPRDMSPPPSPRPSPLGRGRHVFRLSEQGGAADWRRTGERFSLSRGGRAGVRGKGVAEGQLIANFKDLWLEIERRASHRIAQSVFVPTWNE